MEIPELSDATEGLTEAAQEARSLIPWLPSPMVCPTCNDYCRADRKYDPQTAAFHPMGMAPTWYCESCETHYRREEPWHE